LELAREINRHDTIGQDLVGMCLNDILTTGAAPLFFLDYLVTDKLTPAIHAEVVEGVARACAQGGLALIGGETAEHPGKSQGYDLAGFAVGIVDRDKILPKPDITPGDQVLGIPSSGLHSNGYSLVRKIVAESGLSYQEQIPQLDPKASLGEVLIRPTELYTGIMTKLTSQGLIKGAAHITGGGLYENLPRIMPEQTAAELNQDKIPRPPIFDWLAREGPVSMSEMYATFNMGVGMVLVATPKKSEHILATFPQVFPMGRIVSARDQKDKVFIQGVDD
jgi:phosphoribosylaminoimidazole synthetase